MSIYICECNIYNFLNTVYIILPQEQKGEKCKFFPYKCIKIVMTF